jgi:hypothetical protein
MLPTKRTDHVQDSRSLLIEQFKNRTVITGLLDVFSRRAQDLENVFWDIIDKRLLDNALDAQLDALGRLVGEKRDGRNNTAYKKGIRLRIRVNRSKGRSADLVDLLLLWGQVFRYVEYRYLAWSAELEDEPDILYLHALLTQAKAASSYGITRGTTIPPTTGVGLRFCHAGSTPADDQKLDSAYG